MDRISAVKGICNDSEYWIWQMVDIFMVLFLGLDSYNTHLIYLDKCNSFFPLAFEK